MSPAASPTIHSPAQTEQSRRLRGIPQTARPYPSLYQINTRVRLTALSRELQRPATLDDIPDAELDRMLLTELYCY